MDINYKSEAEQKSYFEAALARCHDAELAVGAQSVTLRVADSLIRLIFSGPCLVPHILPAIAHLRIETSEPADLTLHLWESETTGVEMLPPPCQQDHFTDRGDIWGFNSKRFKLAFHWIECSVNLMDLKRGEGIFWVQTSKSLPFWVHASPLRSHFHWWMEKMGHQLLHAAAVATEHGAILITGRGGVGKSTTALTCLTSGMSYLADDYLIVGLEPEPTVYSLYSTAKLNADQMESFPQLTPYVHNPEKLDQEKAVMFLHPDLQKQITLSAPLIAVATPRISGLTDTQIAPTSRQILRRAAAFTTMSQLPYAGRQTHEFIDRLIDNVPSLELSLGSDLEGVAESVREVLRLPAPDLAALQEPNSKNTSTKYPLVTVIVPIHNGAAFIPDVMDNILSQDYPALEIILVNDGSTDNTAEVVANLSVDVRYFEQENSGASAARNRGIKDASGDFIAFLDVDDLWPVNNLKVMLDAIQHDSDFNVVHGYGQLMELDSETGRYEYVGNPIESFPFYIGAALYRHLAFEKVGLFDTELQFAEDTDWFNRALEGKIGIKRLDQVTLLVRRHSQNMTRGKSLVELNTLRVFKKALDRNRKDKTD